MLTPIPAKKCNISEVKEKNNSVFCYSELGVLRVSVYEPAVFRISFDLNETFDANQGNEFTEASDLTSCKDFSLEETDDFICIKTDAIICQVARATSAVSFTDVAGKLIFEEAQEHSHILEQFDVYKSCGNIKTEEVKTADGVKKRVLAADKIFDKTLFHTKLNFAFADDEKLFGLGQAEEGCWNLRATTQYLNQANKKIAIPVLISSKGYGLLFTTQSPCIFSDEQYGSYFYTTADYYLDYFFIAKDGAPSHRQSPAPAKMGAWLHTVTGALRNTERNPRHRRRVQKTRHPCKLHCSRLAQLA